MTESDKLNTSTTASPQISLLSYGYVKESVIIVSYLIIFVVVDVCLRQFETPPHLNLLTFSAGISVAFLLLFSLRYTPALLVAIAITDYWFGSPASSPSGLILSALVFMIGYGAATAALQQTLSIKPRFKSLPDIVWFVLISTFAALVIAVLRSFVIDASAGNSWFGYFLTLRNNWMGEAIGILTLTPFLIIVYDKYWSRRFASSPNPKRGLRSPDRLGHPWLNRKALEISGQIISSALVVIVALASADSQLLYISLLPLIWITLQHGLFGATITALAINLGSLFLVGALGTDSHLLGELQLFMLIFALAALFFGVAISESKATREALQERENLFRRVVSSISDHIYVTDVSKEGEYVNAYLSQHVEALTGYPRQRLLEDWSFWGKSLIYPEDRGVAAAQAAQLAQGNASEVEYRLIRADDHIVWVRDSGRSEQTNQGATIYGVISNITERKALEEMWRKYEFIANASKDFMTLINKDRIYEAVNEAYVEAYHKSREEMVGHLVTDVWGQERYQAGIKTHLDRCFAGEEVRYQEWFEFASLGRRYFDVAYYPYRNAAGLITHAVVISRDITQSKQTEDTLQETIQKLEEAYKQVSSYAEELQVEITERKLIEEQLRQAQKMEAIGRLAGGVAHDFNNILTVIVGYSELLLQRFSDPGDPNRQDVELIRNASERASNLTRQLLAFSRQQTLHPQRLNLNLVIANIEKMLRRLLTENIEFTIRLAPDLGQIKADPSQIDQVLMNLAVNALDAMPEGGSFTIETANKDLSEPYNKHHLQAPPGSYALLTVTDTGSGMDDETLRRIFDPFFTTKEPGKGTGLGLSTVYGIVRQSNGFILIDSQPDQGTMFQIYLPRATDEPQPTPSSIPLSVAASSGSETILLVEDDASVRRVIKHFLMKQGYNVLEAGHPQDALQLCDHFEGELDLLITDVVMPLMNGKVLAQRLTQTYPDLKVLYISGYVDDALNGQDGAASNIMLLEKPFSSNDLGQKVREALDLSPI